MQPSIKLYTDLSGYYDLMCADIDYPEQSSGVRRLNQLFVFEHDYGRIEPWDGQSGNALFFLCKDLEQNRSVPVSKIKSVPFSPGTLLII